MEGSGISIIEWSYWMIKNGGLGFSYTLGALFLICTWQLLLNLNLFFKTRRVHSVSAISRLPPHTPPISTINSNSTASTPASQFRISTLISDLDLKYLINNLDADLKGDEKWDNVIEKRNDLLSYTAKCCKPKEGPLKYLSVTVFENCSVEMLRDFYMDNDYRKTWDKTVLDHQQLEVDVGTGTEIGRTIKKFPLLTPREYVLAWKVWEGINKSFYCFSKECEHPSVPKQKKYVRVSFFKSGWKISKVPGRNACEIRMLHQEDAGLNVEMGKIAFAKGIWSYVCKMDNAFRKYSPTNPIPLLISKVPPGLEATENMTSTSVAENSSEKVVSYQVTHKRKVSRGPSKKFIANGLLLLGGAVCLSRGHTNLGAKVAMAYICSKLAKRGASSQTQNGQVSGL